MMTTEYHDFVDKTVEIIKNRFYFAVTKFTAFKRIKHTKSSHFVSFDDELRYRNFYNDFGPLNISCVFKYCTKIVRLLQNLKGKKQVIHYTSPEANRKTNAAFLAGAFAVVCLKIEPLEIWKKLLLVEPFKSFVDALQRTSPHSIRIFDCLAALQKAVRFNLFDLEDFHTLEYDLIDQIEKGNMNWIVPRKFLAFLGPSDSKSGIAQKPRFYLEYFLEHDVKTVVRLNDKCYDSSAFTEIGIEHFDLYFDDGSPPPMEVLLNFLRISETAPAAIAVHCKAGLGRTGTLIGAYLMKHYLFTAREAVGWLRICRPGSVTGSQQAYLEQNENWLWRSGAEYRVRHYEEESRMPQHKYGIYSRQWPIDRSRILCEARKKFLENKGQNNRNQSKNRSMEYGGARAAHHRSNVEESQYLKHVSKLLATVFAVDDESKAKKHSKGWAGGPTKAKL